MNYNGFNQQVKESSFLELQSFIIEKQEKNEPFFIGRLSGNETNFCGSLLANSNLSSGLQQNMLFGAGIAFKSNEDVSNYVNLYNTSVIHSNLLGVWDGGMYYQAKSYYDYLDKNHPNIKKICAHAIEPFYYIDHPQYKFNTIFKNKKVLIITSHKETTINQLTSKNYEKVFPTSLFDETTEFHVYKPPQQNAGNHDNNSWIIHYEKMKSDLKELKKEFNFDIALVSCGGFGMPISDYIYTELKSSSMYIGGALQLFFGIIGRRWSGSQDITKHVNSYWTSVLDSDKPKNINLCEGGCYW
jgi:hypothetical protein